jgi:hypothetical protein
MVFARQFLAHSFTFASIAAMKTERDILCCAYSSLVAMRLMSPLEVDVEGRVEAENFADQYAPQLQGRERISYCKALMALVRLVHIVQQQTPST